MTNAIPSNSGAGCCQRSGSLVSYDGRRLLDNGKSFWIRKISRSVSRMAPTAFVCRTMRTPIIWGWNAARQPHAFHLR